MTLLTSGLPSIAQLQGRAAPPPQQTPLQVMTAMVQNEKQARQHRTYFRYTSVERSSPHRRPSLDGECRRNPGRSAA